MKDAPKAPPAGRTPPARPIRDALRPERPAAAPEAGDAARPEVEADRRGEPHGPAGEPASKPRRERPVFEVTKAGILAHKAVHPGAAPRGSAAPGRSAAPRGSVAPGRSAVPGSSDGFTRSGPSADLRTLEEAAPRGSTSEANATRTPRSPGGVERPSGGRAGYPWGSEAEHPRIHRREDSERRERRAPFVPDGFEDPELAPPPFLSPLEAMSDIYRRVRGRMSPKTRTLLESPALEDLVALLAALQTREDLLQRAEARFDRRLCGALAPDPGPVVLGFHDARLAEPWRLFLSEWDIWAPDDGDAGGVELFWEGEVEDEEGRPTALLSSLTFQRGEATLYARMGDLEDRITFDGETFFRLKTELAPGRGPS